MEWNRIRGPHLVHAVLHPGAEVEVDEEMFIAWQDGEPSTNAPEERAVRRRVHGDMQVGAPFSGGG